MTINIIDFIQYIHKIFFISFQISKKYSLAISLTIFHNQIKYIHKSDQNLIKKVSE